MKLAPGCRSTRRLPAVGRYKHTPGEQMPDLFVQAQALAAARANVLATRIPVLVIVIAGLPPDATLVWR